MKAQTLDVLIVGAGLAGLYTALQLDPSLNIVILNKFGLDQSNSMYAQGGIAAAVAEDDSPDLHFADSMVAGSNLCNKDALRVLVDEGKGGDKRAQGQGIAKEQPAVSQTLQQRPYRLFDEHGRQGHGDEGKTGLERRRKGETLTSQDDDVRCEYAGSR